MATLVVKKPAPMYELGLTELEAMGLRALLYRNLSRCAIEAIGLDSLAEKLDVIAPAKVTLVHSAINSECLQATNNART